MSDIKKKKRVSRQPDGITKAIVRSTIAYLKSITDCCLSGDDSELANLWEELCV